MSLDLYAQNVNEKIAEFNNKYSILNQVIVEDVKEDIHENYDGNFINAKTIWLDIEAKLNTNQFYALSTLGAQGSGKTTLGKEFFEIALKKNFKCVYAIPEDFLHDIDGWIDRILVDPKENNCIMLDDLSYSNDAQTRKNQALFKNVIARIRHKFTENDDDQQLSSKVFIIYVTHRLHAAPPMLRNSGSWIFTEMQSADRDDALEVLGKNKELRERLDQIYTFLNKVIFEGAKKGKIKYTLGDKNYVFNWGRQEAPGDGRLMAVYHAGDISIYNSKLPEKFIDLGDFRYRVPQIENAIIPGKEL